MTAAPPARARMAPGSGTETYIMYVDYTYIKRIPSTKPLTLIKPFDKRGVRMQSIETVQGRADGCLSGGNVAGDLTGEVLVRALDDGEIELIIDSEEQGEVSLYLERLDAQDLVRALNKALGRCPE